MTADPASDNQTPEHRLFEQMAHLLHDLCQPLTALQCRLEIDQMEHEGQPPTSRDRTVADCVKECARMNQTVAGLRGLVRQAMTNQRGSLG